MARPSSSESSHPLAMLATLLCAFAISPLAAQLAPSGATIFRLAINEDLGMGSALAAGDFDGDGADDLAMGAPLGADGGLVGSGAVVLRYGGGGVQFLLQSGSGLAVAEAGDRFGTALAAGDLDCDGYDDLAVGIPWEDVGNSLDTGAVLVFYGSAAGLPSTAGDLLLLADVDDAGNQNFADFGSVLTVLDYGTARELAIGSPSHDIPIAIDLGAVYVVPHECPGVGFQTASTLRLIQGVGGVSGFPDIGDSFGSAMATGDFNGDGRVDLGVGVPGNHWGPTPEGAIQVFYGAVSGLGIGDDEQWYQGSAGVPGTAEDGDQFGAALAAADFDGDGYDDLAVGVPGEDVGALAEAGGVDILYGSAAGISGVGAQYFDQDTPEVINSVEAMDHFGQALAAGDFSGNGIADLAIGVPDENFGVFADAGIVNVLYGTPSGLTAHGSQGLSEDSLPAPAASADSDRFGLCLATIDLEGDGIRDLVAAAPHDLYNGYLVGLVAVVPGWPLFADGFEWGDTWRWSFTQP